MTLHQPRVTAKLFGSGKLLLTGAQTEAQARYAARKIGRAVKRVGFQGVRLRNFKVTNFVASADVGFGVRLEHLSRSIGPLCAYEPETFPAAKYHLEIPVKCYMSVFASGKVNLTGSTTRDGIYTAFEHLYPQLAASARHTAM